LEVLTFYVQYQVLSLLRAAIAALCKHHRDNHKRAHYARRHLCSSVEAAPVSVESYGRLGVLAYALLCRAADVAAAFARVSKSAFVDSALRDTSVTLCKGACVDDARVPWARRSRQWRRVHAGPGGAYGGGDRGGR
jgi:hypothetical protein